MRAGSLALLCSCLFLSGASAASSEEKLYSIFMSPAGSDANDGLSPDSPILTLERAQQILVEAKPEGDVEIQIAPGTYYDQRVRWTFTMPENSIKFMPLNDTKERPVFDGCPGPDAGGSECEGGIWFTLASAKGENTNIHFHYVRVERYTTAISFEGDRNSLSRYNGGNRVYGSYFKYIGNNFNPGLEPSTAAIRMVNSNDNWIRNSHFINVENVGRGGGLIHALYLAHGSSGNQIVRNRFVEVSGDAIRLRDASNRNRISRNSISRAGSVGFSDWYCDHGSRNDCTKRDPECPSWDNEFRGNVLNGTYQCRAMDEYAFYQDETAPGCPMPAQDAPRLRTSGNIRKDEPCS